MTPTCASWKKGAALGLIAPAARERFLRYRDLVLDGGGGGFELAPWSMAKVLEQREIRSSYEPYISRERGLRRAPESRGNSW